MDVVVLPFRDPLVLAQQCATIDVLSGGRLRPGFGVGPGGVPEWQGQPPVPGCQSQPPTNSPFAGDQAGRGATNAGQRLAQFVAYLRRSLDTGFITAGSAFIPAVWPRRRGRSPNGCR
jgi:alkanesulfonate monooxygenase SsuD/methylene tetrahydromethanopterin reductase-like flavin-dependent oxidoreductase (luciferase family)